MELPSKSMRAVIVDRAAPGGLRIANVAHPVPAMSEALVRVAATSLSSGEVELALAGGVTGTRPGWDLAGTIEVSAADGTGPPVGTRVVGLICAGAWAELVAVPTGSLAVLPPAVPFAQAAALPVAGLTALHALSLGGLLAGKQVLIVGATSSTGLFAVQLAYASGACITAVIRHPEHEALVEEFGAQHVVVGDVAGAASFGRYHLSLDTVGGPRAAGVLRLLRPGGTGVLIHGTGTPDASSAGPPRSSKEGAGLHRFSLRDALCHEPASEGLERLVILAKTHKVYPHVEVEGALTDIVALAQALLDPSFVGKTVLLA